MTFIVYKILEDEPNKGYYWGMYEDPVKLANSCFDLAKKGLYGIKVVPVENTLHIPQLVEW